ncbi:MAG: hypothetical protein WD960_11885 [Gemmatimonadota bacterium]
MIRLLRLGPFRNAFLARGLIAWVGIRVLAAGVEITSPNLLQQIWIVGLAAAVVYLDARRRDEDLFLGNLGIPRFAIGVNALPFPILMEIVLR